MGASNKYFGSSEVKPSKTVTECVHEVREIQQKHSYESVPCLKTKLESQAIKAIKVNRAEKNFIDDSLGWNMPFPPHDVQREMISTLLRAARSGSNAIIDSPTGTGKTLALLCGGLKYHQELRSTPVKQRTEMNAKHTESKKNQHLNITVLGENTRNAQSTGIKRKINTLDRPGGPDANRVGRGVPPIFYCSRTHSQLRQVINELRTVAKSDTHMNVLASREHYCINERVRTGLENRSNNLGEMCDKAVVMNQCSASDNYESLAGIIASVPHEWQIEDLLENGKAMDACPYYAARDLIFNAYINFCPYNYILDPIIRHETKIEGTLRDAVVILDEAHNIDEISRSALEWQWSKASLHTVIEEMQEFAEGNPVFYSKKSLTEKTEKCSEMSALVRKLAMELRDCIEAEASLNPTAISQSAYRGPATKSARDGSSKIYFSHEIDAKMPLILSIRNDKDQQKLFASTLRSFLDFGVTFNTLDVEVRSVHTIKQTLLFLHLFLFRKSAFSIGIDGGAETMEVYCADSSLAFKLLEQDVRCVILSSGTLPPTEFISKELGVPFREEVRCGHVVDVNKAVFARVVPSFGKCLYVTMYATDFIDRVGKLLVRASESTAHGRLCFFPSYRCLDVYWNRWSSTNVRRELERHGVSIFQEPRSTKSFGNVLHSFKTSSKRPKGALLLAVYRGKAAEGIDFKDNMARLIVCIGVPYKSATENRTIVKRKFNTEHSSLSGDLWYKTDAVTAVNQAIGRCIRHQNDYGVLLLIDERWGKELLHMLPKWLRGSIQTATDFDDLFSSMRLFLNEKMRPKEVKKEEYIEIS